MLIRPNLLLITIVLGLGIWTKHHLPWNLLSVVAAPVVVAWLGLSAITLANGGPFTPAWGATAYGPPSHMLSVIELDRRGPEALREAIVRARFTPSKPGLQQYAVFKAVEEYHQTSGESRYHAALQTRAMGIALMKRYPSIYIQSFTGAFGDAFFGDITQFAPEPRYQRFSRVSNLGLRGFRIIWLVFGLALLLRSIAASVNCQSSPARVLAIGALLTIVMSAAIQPAQQIRLALPCVPLMMLVLAMPRQSIHLREIVVP